MKTIEVSTETFAAIWSVRADGEETEDAVLRRVLAAGKRQPDHAFIEVDAAKRGETWVDSLVAAFGRPEAPMPLAAIYQGTKKRRLALGERLPRTWEAVIRRTLENHSSDSKNYLGTRDLFRLVDRGVWCLRRSATP